MLVCIAHFQISFPLSVSDVRDGNVQQNHLKAAFTHQTNVGQLVLVNSKKLANSCLHTSNNNIRRFATMVPVVQWHTRRVAASYLLLFCVLRRRKNRKRWRNRKISMKPYIARNPSLGAYNTLVQEFRAEDASGFNNFLRMDQTCFDELLEMVKPQKKKQDTNMRQTIPTGEKLALTLRYLATSEFFFCLHPVRIFNGFYEQRYAIPYGQKTSHILQYCGLFYMLTVSINIMHL